MRPGRRAAERNIGAGQFFLKYRRGRWGQTKEGGECYGRNNIIIYYKLISITYGYNRMFLYMYMNEDKSSHFRSWMRKETRAAA
jgi:hypothetical protein